MKAEAYNAKAEGDVWQKSWLPSDFNDLRSGSPEFAEKVRERQERYGLDADGKLGMITLETLERSENLRLGRVSGFASKVHNLIPRQHPSKRKEPKRKGFIKYLIIHTTGSGIVGKADSKDLDPYKYAVNYYTGPKAYTSHFLAGHKEGEFCQIVGLDEVAFHAGIGKEGKGRYRSGMWSGVNYPLGKKGPVYLTDTQAPKYYGWWRKKWSKHGVTNPMDLTGGDPNGTSIGFDFLGHRWGQTYTDWQYKCLANLCLYLHEEVDMPLDERHILTHSDTHPIQRCNSKGAWDPGSKFSFTKLMETIEQEK